MTPREDARQAAEAAEAIGMRSGRREAATAGRIARAAAKRAETAGAMPEARRAWAAAGYADRIARAIVLTGR